QQPRAQTLQDAPKTFRVALDQLRQATTRTEVELNEIPAPSKLATYAVAMGAEVTNADGDASAVGGFILLYDNQHSDIWDGNFRIVTYIRTSIESDLGEDPMVSAGAWTSSLAPLHAGEARYRQRGGTATRVVSKGFGMLDHQYETIDLELRASWTPSGDHLNRHLTGWRDMVCTFAGLPPATEGVIPLNLMRRTARFLAHILP